MSQSYPARREVGAGQPKSRAGRTPTLSSTIDPREQFTLKHVELWREGGSDVPHSLTWNSSPISQWSPYFQLATPAIRNNRRARTTNTPYSENETAECGSYDVTRLQACIGAAPTAMQMRMRNLCNSSTSAATCSFVDCAGAILATILQGKSKMRQ